MTAIRNFAVSLALLASASSGPALADGSTQGTSDAAETARKVRVIDISAANAGTSDQTRWYHRVPSKPIQKNAPKVETASTEPRSPKPSKAKTVRRAVAAQDVYASYASERVRENRGFGLFSW